MSVRTTPEKKAALDALRQRVRDAQAAYREAEKKVAPARKALKISLREADAARSELRKAENALDAIRAFEHGRRVGAKIYKHSEDLARTVLDRWAHLAEQPADAIRLGIEVHSDGTMGPFQVNYGALAELRRLLKTKKKRGGK